MNQKYDDARPSIPAEIKRQIFIDSGHACAITHCHNILLNIHHIDGNRENNNPANLIALCSAHHDRAHDKGRARLTPQDLLAYKRKQAHSAPEPSRLTFVPAEESKRVAIFVDKVRAALSWHDGEQIQSIDDQLGYWFPVEVYNGICELLNNRRSYEVDMRSFDPEAVTHQDLIIDLIRALVCEVAEKPYVQIGYCYTFRPGDKGSPGYDEKVAWQMAHINKMSAQIRHHLLYLDGYTAQR